MRLTDHIRIGGTDIKMSHALTVIDWDTLPGPVGVGLTLKAQNTVNSPQRTGIILAIGNEIQIKIQT